MVRLSPKSWFVRQKVLGANIHKTEGLLIRQISLIFLFLIVNLVTCLLTGRVSAHIFTSP